MKTLITVPTSRLEGIAERIEAVVADLPREVDPEEVRRLSGPVGYLESAGWTLYPWQKWVYENAGPNLLLTAARQVGKTFLAGGKARSKQVSVKGSVTPIVCPNQEKSKILIKRIKEIVAGSPNHLGKDEYFTKWEPGSTEELGEHGSLIKGLPGSLGGVVGLTAPLLMYDEAGLCAQELYDGGTPMQAHVDNPELWVLSSAWWKAGWYWKEWNEGTSWTKVLVRPPFKLEDGRIVDMSESEKLDMLAEQTAKHIKLFFSETPTKAFIELERSREGHPDWQIRQQYFCEFQDVEDRAFPPEYVERMWDSTVEPFKIGGDHGVWDETVEPLKLPGRKIG